MYSKFRVFEYISHFILGFAMVDNEKIFLLIDHHCKINLLNFLQGVCGIIIHQLDMEIKIFLSNLIEIVLVLVQ